MKAMIDEILKRIIGDRDLTDEMLEDVKKLKDSYDEQKGMAEYWKAKYDELRGKYIDRFFTTPEEVKEDTREDVEKDGEVLTFEELFDEREGDYKYAD